MCISSGSLQSYNKWKAVTTEVAEYCSKPSIAGLIHSSNPPDNMPPPTISGLKDLSNPLATPDQLSNSSSSVDGVPPDLERSIRFAGALLTQAAGVLLRLPQETIAQAIVTFTRFWIGTEGGSLRIYSVKV